MCIRDRYYAAIYTPIYCMMHRVDTGEMAVIVDIVVYVSIVDDSAVFLKPVKEHL